MPIILNVVCFATTVAYFLAGGVRGETCSNGTVSVSVLNVADARNLSTLLNCSGVQTFVVDWAGEVVIEQPLRVESGDKLSIIGVSAETAVIDGGQEVQLFVLEDNTELILEGITLTRGRTELNGAAVYTLGESSTKITFIDCVFEYNVAAESGGEDLCMYNVFSTHACSCSYWQP